MTLDIFADDNGAALQQGDMVWPLPPKPALSKWWIVAVGILLALLFLRGCNRGGDDDRSIVDVDGLHVMIVEDVNARDKLSQDQLAIFNSIEVREWCDKNCAPDGYRNYDVDDSMDNEPEVFKRMRAGLTIEPPAMVVANGRKGAQMKLPASPEAQIRELTKFVRRR